MSNTQSSRHISRSTQRIYVYQDTMANGDDLLKSGESFLTEQMAESEVLSLFEHTLSMMRNPGKDQIRVLIEASSPKGVSDGEQ